MQSTPDINDAATSMLLLNNNNNNNNTTTTTTTTTPHNNNNNNNTRRRTRGPYKKRPRIPPASQETRKRSKTSAKDQVWSKQAYGFRIDETLKILAEKLEPPYTPLKRQKLVKEYEKLFMPIGDFYFTIRKVYENNTAEKRPHVNHLMSYKLRQVFSKIKAFEAILKKIYTDRPEMAIKIMRQWLSNAMFEAGYVSRGSSRRIANGSSGNSNGSSGNSKKRGGKRRKSRRKRRKSRRKRRKSRRKKRR